MMNKDEFKRQVYNKYQNEVCACKEKKLRTSKFVAVFTCILMAGGFVYASARFNNSKKIEEIHDKGVQIAIKNDYVQNIDMNYIETKDVKFKVDYLVMDDLHLDLVFNFLTPDNVDNYEGIAITNLKITDENNNQIYNSSEDQAIWCKNIATTTETWSVVEKHDNILRQVCHLYSYNFPNSNKIYVNFSNVVLYNVNKGNPIIIEYNDSYKMEIDVSEQLANRKSISYSSNDEFIKSAKLTNSGFAVIIKSDRYVTSDENYKLIDESGKEYKLSTVTHVIEPELQDYKTDEFILIFDATIYDGHWGRLILTSPSVNVILNVDENASF